ncbi:MAG: hypothetical protein HY924_01265 [Elusimicrobia bacterium]|nr:hypothetical protein [Elusimicrobiota bacterium]
MPTFLLSVLLAFACPAAAGPFPASLDGLFDGKAKVEVDLIPRFQPKSLVQPHPGTAPAFVAVKVELSVLPVSDFDRQAQVVDAGLKVLLREHGFIRDMSSEPELLDSPGQIPQDPGPRPFVYEVRGFMPAGSFPASSRAGLKAARDDKRPAPSEDESALLSVLIANLNRMLAVPGVAAAGLGWDCLAKGEHLHVLPHHPAIVVETARHAVPASVRSALLGALPELRDAPLFVGVRPRPYPAF